MLQYFLMKPREKKRILFRLNHIEESIIEIHAFSKAISSEKEFLNSRERQLILSKLIQDIGEAMNIISSKIRPEIVEEYPHLEWSKMISLRHYIVHEYFKPDLTTIWQTVLQEIPTLEKEIPKFKNYVLSQE